ncbi:murein hydrolase activator EnvC [Cellulomonas sp. PhB143]|uniref:murein hydrolase activator EnvC family protein n=1 Tax=Cellulomonas sp. PhB143 TaxID=2485186 RepID=UPI000FBAFAC8|nr:M23 family metallopeptidase [Cellulomonas sp. PhB143]ROS77125.1 peptidase M23-like protein [Cellulomonas sp. PhB143]
MASPIVPAPVPAAGRTGAPSGATAGARPRAQRAVLAAAVVLLLAGSPSTAAVGTAGTRAAGTGAAGAQAMDTAGAGSWTLGPGPTGAPRAVGVPREADPRRPGGDASADAVWVLPLPGPADVAAPADLPAHDWLPGHRGVDLRAAPGATVLSPADGVVTFAGPVAGRRVLVVTHDGGLRTSLEPVAALVDVGDRVRRGDAVGTLTDDAGHCDGPCVHWGVRRGERYLDPMVLLAQGDPVVLLPLGRLPAVS